MPDWISDGKFGIQLAIDELFDAAFSSPHEG